MRAVIFDLDGTLWDATGQTFAVWNAVFARHPEIGLRVTQAEKKALMGLTMSEIGERLFPGMDAAARNALMDECGDAEVEQLQQTGGTLYTGLRETLKALCETRGLYIVSNCQDGYLQAFLTFHGFGALFADYEMSGRTGRGKGEKIRLLMERNGIEAAVYVGDTQGDERSAREAGIPFIHAAYGFGTAQAPDAVIRDIAELPDALLKLDAQGGR